MTVSHGVRRQSLSAVSFQVYRAPSLVTLSALVSHIFIVLVVCSEYCCSLLGVINSVVSVVYYVVVCLFMITNI